MVKNPFDVDIFGTDVEPSGNVFSRWASLTLVIPTKEFDAFDEKLCFWLKKCASDAIVLARTPKWQREEKGKVTYRLFAKKKSDLVLLKLRWEQIEEYYEEPV